MHPCLPRYFKKTLILRMLGLTLIQGYAKNVGTQVLIRKLVTQVNGNVEVMHVYDHTDFR